MRENTKNQNRSKKVIIIALVILALLLTIIIFTKTEKNNKINNIKQDTSEFIATEEPYTIENQITDKPNKPVISAGMIPIKWVNDSWVITTESDIEWYDYENGNMANMMLNDRKIPVRKDNGWTRNCY